MFCPNDGRCLIERAVTSITVITRAGNAVVRNCIAAVCDRCVKRVSSAVATSALWDFGLPLAAIALDRVGGKSLFGAQIRWMGSAAQQEWLCETTAKLYEEEIRRRATFVEWRADDGESLRSYISMRVG